MKRYLSVLLTFTIILMMTPATLIVGAASQSLPEKLEFNTDGAFSSGTDGITFNSGTMTVSNGILKMTAKGTEKVHDSAEGTHLYFDFNAVTSGTLVFEVDYSTSGISTSNHLVSMYGSNGNEILRLSAGQVGASKTYVNGSTAVRINNKRWNATDGIYGLKFEINLDNDTWRMYQATSKTDGVWVYGDPLKYVDDSNPDGSFSFMNASADVAKIRVALYQQDAALDNFKVYKKVTAAQTSTQYDMLEGQTQQAGIAFSPAADKPSDLVWKSSNESIATVNQSGEITARSAGTAEITVKSAFYDSINYTYTVNVKREADALAIDKEIMTLCVGDSAAFIVSPVPANSTYHDLAWSSSDNAVAEVSVDGVVTGKGKGNTTITATAIGKNGAISISAVVTVIKPLTGLSISAPKTSLTVGETTTFTAVVAPTDASDVEKEWSSGNPYVATVDQSGNVTAIGKGSTEIYVSASGFNASQSVTVTSNILSTAALPYKNEFNTDGVFLSGTDSITYNSGAVTISNGMLKVTEIGTEVVNESAKGTHLYLDFNPVTSGTLVFETDFSTTAPTSKNNLISMYDNNETEILRVNFSKANANDGYVNGNSDDDYRITNTKFDSADNLYGFKFEVDLDNGTWRIYLAKSKTDGVWDYGEPLKYVGGPNKDVSNFVFMNDVENVSKIRFALYQQDAGVDNFKVYKKVSATQSATQYNMLVGDTQQAGITYTTADKTYDIVWSSSDESIAAVNQSGEITAKAVGTAVIKAKSAFYDAINYTYTVNIMNEADSLAIDKETMIICVGDTATLKVSPVPENSVHRQLVWSSSDNTVAEISADGVVTGKGKGSATITASAIGKNGTISVSSMVTVIKPLTGLSISASKTFLSVDERTTFAAVVAPSDASAVEKKWRSGNPYVATVDQSGNVTAIGEGSTEIYVSASGFTASQTVTVTSNTAVPSGKKPAFVSFYTPTGYSFYDISDMEWAQAAVYSAVATGVITPDSETTFGAKRNIKRDEFVSVVIKTLKLSAKQGNSENKEMLKKFTDVSESNPYYAEIMKALELGIIQGVSEIEFAPDADITRQDMAVVVTNAFKVASVKTEEGRLDFADKELIAEYAQTAVRILSKMGIILGKDNNLFDPLANTTRAEVCVIVDRINTVR